MIEENIMALYYKSLKKLKLILQIKNYIYS